MSTPRRFDWDEAQRLRNDGLSYPQIAARLGVTHGSVIHALNPELRAEQYAKKNARKRLERALNGPTPTLICSSCRSDKPDADFPRQTRSTRRRGRSTECTACGSARRRADRERKRNAIILDGQPTCSAVGCFHSATGTINYGTFRNWIPLPNKAMAKLDRGVPLCTEHHTTATAGSATTAGMRPRSAPTLEGVVSRARVFA